MAEAGKLAFTCPHCDTPARVRTAKPVTPIIRDLYYECTNFECRYTFVAQISLVHTLRPSFRPRPGLHIPVSPAFKPANDIAPWAANDSSSRPPVDDLPLRL